MNPNPLNITPKKYENNFNFLKLFLAVMVLFGHSFEILNFHDKIPYLYIDGAGLGSMRTRGFFVISGFLVHKSLTRSNGISNFLFKRVKRIFPALFVLSIVVVLASSIVSTLSFRAYFANLETYHYLFGTWILLPSAKYLPGVFTNNPLSAVVNPSLWTLRYEILFYVLLAFCYPLNTKQKRILFATVSILGIIYTSLIGLQISKAAWFISKHNYDFSYLITHFALGAFFSLYTFTSKKKNILGLVLCLCAYSLLSIIHINAAIIIIAYALMLICFAHLYIPFLDISKLRIGDISYGTYLYGFPLQQIILTYFVISSPYALFYITLPFALICGWLSWQFVEKKFVNAR